MSKVKAWLIHHGRSLELDVIRFAAPDWGGLGHSPRPLGDMSLLVAQGKALPEIFNLAVRGARVDLRLEYERLRWNVTDAIITAEFKSDGEGGTGLSIGLSGKTSPPTPIK